MNKDIEKLERDIMRTGIIILILCFLVLFYVVFLFYFMLTKG